jgi:5S rRNA maturation endonuclease (ribonuclease M5)
MIDKRERMLQAFGAFLSDFVRDLNHRSEDGWTLLVEGKRDEMALRELGCRGRIATISSFSRLGGKTSGGSKSVIILTDLDREGGKLAARFVKKLSHDGFTPSLVERRRLKVASRGVFLHIENLSRFAEPAV